MFNQHLGCSFGPARTLSPVGGDHKSHTLWGNEILVATTSVGKSFGNGCCEKQFGRGEGFALSFPSTHERHHSREKLFQLSVLHFQGSSLLFPSLIFGKNVPLEVIQGWRLGMQLEGCLGSGSAPLGAGSPEVLPGGRKKLCPAHPASGDVWQCPRGKLFCLH